MWLIIIIIMIVIVNAVISANKNPQYFLKQRISRVNYEKLLNIFFKNLSGYVTGKNYWEFDFRF